MLHICWIILCWSKDIKIYSSLKAWWWVGPQSWKGFKGFFFFDYVWYAPLALALGFQCTSHRFFRASVPFLDSELGWVWIYLSLVSLSLFSHCCWSVVVFLFTVSSRTITCVITLLPRGRSLFVEKTTAPPWTFGALQKSVRDLVVMGSTYWRSLLVLIFEFHLNVIISVWPPHPRWVFWPPQS